MVQEINVQDKVNVQKEQYVLEEFKLVAYHQHQQGLEHIQIQMEQQVVQIYQVTQR